jgi:hypothetical protein
MPPLRQPAHSHARADLPLSGHGLASARRVTTRPQRPDLRKLVENPSTVPQVCLIGFFLAVPRRIPRYTSGHRPPIPATWSTVCLRGAL